MKLDLNRTPDREMYLTAARHFLAHDPGELNESCETFASRFGQANQCEIGFADGYPKYVSLDFKDDQAYTMFLLRWS